MDDILIDFETFGVLNLPKVGAAVYARHPATDIISLSWSIAELKKLWIPGMPFPEALLDGIVRRALLVEAHGSMFEREIWKHVGERLYKFPPIFEKQWRCSLSVCGYRSLPMKLEKVADVLRLPVQKDMVGHKAMKKLCAPNKNGNRIVDDFELEQKTYSYCLTDNDTERALGARIGRLPAGELAVWQMDQRMQQRGIRIDQELCHAAMDIAKQVEAKLLPEVPKVTKGAVDTIGQVAEVKKWLHSQNVHLDDLTADSVKAALTPALKETRPEAYRLLELRQTLAMTSYKKYARALICICDDGRSRGATQYHGAGTGRWAGRLWQPQNLRRPRFFGEGEDIYALTEAIKSRDPHFLSMVAGCDPMEALADGVRGMIISEEQNTLISGDYAAIEAVVTAGLAGEQSKLDVFRQGGDPYCWFASKVTGRHIPGKNDPNFTEQDGKDRQNMGKPGELAFGFSGAIGAWRKFDDSDKFDDTEVDGFKNIWRESHPNICHMWNSLDWCAMQAVSNSGKVFKFVGKGNDPCQGVAYVVKGDFLLCRLPAGRMIHYYRPEIRNTLMPWTDDNDDPVYKPQVWFWTNSAKGWRFVKGWRGLWTENIVQATARDIMVAGMFMLDRKQIPLILTVHDELLSEMDERFAPTAAEYSDLIVCPPPYAKSWPISASGWVGTTYRKDK